MSGAVPVSDRASRARILALDDEPLILEQYRRLFHERAEVLDSVAAGLSKLKKDEELRIVLLDFRMRDGGIPFLKNLKKRFPERVPIVVHEAADPPDAAEMKALGVHRCVEKSQTRFDVLEDAIKDAVALLRLRDATQGKA